MHHTCFLHDRLHRDGDELSEELAQAEPDAGEAELRGPGHPRHLAHAAHHCNTALVSTCSSAMWPSLLCATICMLVSQLLQTCVKGDKIKLYKYNGLAANRWIFSIDIIKKQAIVNNPRQYV